MVEKIKQDFSLMAVLLIPASVGINVISGQLCQILRLPIFLDSIGTLFLGILAGPWVGALTGFLTNAINGIFNPVLFAYSLTSITVGFLAGVLANQKMFIKPWRIGISLLFIVLASTITSGLITAVVFNGATGAVGSIFTATLMAAGNNILTSVFSVQIFQEIIDKLLSLFLVLSLVSGVSNRYLVKFKNGKYYLH